MALQLAAANWHTHKDASAWADVIRARAPGAVTQVDFVEDMARYGLHLHLGADVEKLSVEPLRESRFNPEYDEAIADELGDDFDPHALWITKREHWPAVRDALARHGAVAVPQGSPYEGRILFRVRPR